MESGAKGTLHDVMCRDVLYQDEEPVSSSADHKDSEFESKGGAGGAGAEPSVESKEAKPLFDFSASTTSGETLAQKYDADNRAGAAFLLEGAAVTSKTTARSLLDRGHRFQLLRFLFHFFKRRARREGTCR